MIKVLVIAEREIQERAFVFLAAAALAVAPFLALLVPSANFADRMSATTMLGLILATAFVVGLGILLGVSLIGRESREKRLSFYFARPVGGSTIWFGKLIAAVALLVGSAAVIFAPGMLLVPTAWRGIWDLSIWRLVGVVLIFAGSLVVVFHTAATMIRSRSLLLALDFIAAAAFLILLWSALLPILIQRPGPRLAAAMTAVLGGAICAALIIGGAWQLSRGRIDPKRSHRELSIAVWCALAVVLAGSAAGVHWFTSVTPHDLATHFFPDMVSDSTVVVGGQARHRFDLTSFFLFNTANGAWERVPQSLANKGWVNPAGTVAIWVKPPQPIVALVDLLRRRNSGEIDLQVSRLSGATWETRDSGISVTTHRGSLFAMQLSPSGDNLAVLSSETLTIFNLADGRSVGSARLPLQGYVRMKFVGAHAVVVTSVPWTSSRRLLATQALAPLPDTVAYRFNARTRSLQRLLAVPTAADSIGRAIVSNDGRTLALRIHRSASREVNQIRLFDLTTGSEKGAIAGAGPQPFSALMLRDGTIAVAQSHGGQALLQLYSDSGVPLRSIDLGRGKWVRVGGELPDGRLVVSVASTLMWSGERARGWEILAIDAKSNAVTRVAKNLMLLSQDWFGDSVASRTVFSALDSNGLVAWNALTGERRLLVAMR